MTKTATDYAQELYANRYVKAEGHVDYQHDSAHVRLTAKYVRKAHKLFKKGRVADALTCVRIASKFGEDMMIDSAGNVVPVEWWNAK